MATKKTKTGEKTTTLLRTSQGTWAGSNIEKAYALAEHLADVFLPHSSENEPKREEAHIQLREDLTNSNHQSTVSKELTFKKTAAA
jgi:DNA polymerase IIIc chi subunit